jgi:YbbR domain-containing protein
MISRLWHLLVDNSALKLAALIIAVLMWYGVAHDPVSEVSVRVPVEFSHPPKNMEYITDVLPQVQIRLRGPVRELRQLQPESIRLILDLRNATPGERTFDITPEQIQVPHDIEVMEVTPGRLHMTFDTRTTRQVPVKPRVVGTPAPGYRLVSIVVTPAVLNITGPSRHVNAVENAVTDAIDDSGVAGQASFETMPYVADPLVHVSAPGPVRVIVRTQPSSSKAGVQ